MKFVLAVVAAMTLAMGAQAADFSGKWELDREASRDLPKFMVGNLKSWTLDVAQKGSEMRVTVQITTNSGEGGVNPTFLYNLDGSAPVEMAIRTPEGAKKVPATAVGKRNPNGTVSLVTSGEMEMGGQTVKLANEEKWTLLEEGKVLTVERTDHTPRGPVTYVLHFRRIVAN